MKYINSLSIFVVLLVFANCSFSGALSNDEVENIHSDINEMYTAFEAGDASIFLKKTHRSIFVLVGGREKYKKLIESSIEQYSSPETKIISTDLGVPTSLYDSGSEEVCFVPRISKMETKGEVGVSTSFMIAVRKKGGKNWFYLDGAGLRKDQGLLWKLLPDLTKEVLFPPNYVIIL